MAREVDVVICGGGSAGLCAGVWLARSGIRKFAVLERRGGPLARGQADGVQCRTAEVLESFGLADALLRDAFHVLEVAFWSSSSSSGPPPAEPEDGGIRRTHAVADTEDGLSHLPHVILNQARVNALLAAEMRRAAAAREHVVYGCEVTGLRVDSARARDPDAYCATVTAVREGVEEEYRAKYVLACDGAHSFIRKALGVQMVGDSSDAVWGVMDVYPRTDFPDIRKKCVVTSAAGNLLVIPREGDALVRFYLEMPPGAAAGDVTPGALRRRARDILAPYALEVAETAWWSAYAVGQRLADRFHADRRVFLAGDAAHTHSPKAGQGMNVSLQDGYNLGWKLAAVLRRQAPPELLDTYVAERRKTAADLIDFDRYWTRLFSSAYRREHGVTPELFREHFVKAGRYTAGQALQYDDSIITSARGSNGAVATNLTVGMRFPSAQVLRLCDSRALQLVRALPADSRWHVVVFAGDICEAAARSRLEAISKDLEHAVRHFTPARADLDARINLVLVLASKRGDVGMEDIPSVFTPVTGQWRMKNILNVFIDDEGYNRSGHGHAYRTYGIDPGEGAMVIVRPDQYIAKICALGDVDAVREFFSGFMRNPP
ncbi:FAD binding domain-containing protein [Xylariomycetidae sp. FL0641]|nr:FAD binding domain-containing protein [Xylariomycetidae sp. FL0641]